MMKLNSLAARIFAPEWPHIVAGGFILRFADGRNQTSWFKRQSVLVCTSLARDGLAVTLFGYIKVLPPVCSIYHDVQGLVIETPETNLEPPCFWQVKGASTERRLRCLFPSLLRIKFQAWQNSYKLSQLCTKARH